MSGWFGWANMEQNEEEELENPEKKNILSRGGKKEKKKNFNQSSFRECI
jgi:hypothetical protein